ncbi:MAG: signal transduction histidine kinase/streptogramin lyase, partial [Rhodothermales bacterium]
PFPEEADGSANNQVGHLAWDPNQSDVIWTQSAAGLLRLSISSGRFDRYENDPGDPNSLASNQVNTVFADRSGTMWVGYGNKGIGRFNPKSVAIRHIAANADRPQEGLPVGNVWAMHASEDFLWVGVAEVNSHALIQFDLATGEVRQQRSSQSDPNTLWPEGSVQSILLDSQGTLWVGTSGLNRCTPGTLVCERIPRATSREDSSRVWGSTIHAIYEAPDEPGVLWLGGIGRALQRYEVATGVVTNYEGSFADLSKLPNSIADALLASDGGLWLASQSGGLARLDRETGAVERYAYNERDTLGVASGQIETILEMDSVPGVLWLATQAGLNRFDLATRTVRHFTEDDGLANNHLYGVLEGDDGQLWMSSNRGISAFDPEAETFRNYGLDDGLRELEFMQNAWTRGPGGMLYFGDVSGIVSFAPAQLNTNPTAPTIAFTGLRVNGREVQPSDGGALSAPITQTDAIELEYSQNDFAVDFVALHFSDPSRNQYAYQLEGYDEDWIDAGNSRSASFTNLPPGDYTLRVRAANPDGVWNEEGISLGVTVLPPWYRTAWAYLLFAAMLAGGVFAIDRIQRHRLLKAEHARADLAEIELRAEAAESEARALQADNDRKKNIERLSDIGKEITASLDFETIFGRVYHHINDLTDAPVFGVGIYHPEVSEIEYRMAIENGKRYRPYTRDTKDKNQLPVWCIENRAPVFINDVELEYSKYIEELEQESGMLEDGSAATQPSSMIYLPLLTQDRILGVITVQSFKKHAYTQNDLNLLQTISAYASVALDNANAYRQLNGIVAELRETQQQLVHQEKMASLGQLTAGIAHEIKNPLNFVNNFADVNAELAGELRDLVEGNDTAALAEKREEMDELIASLQLNSMQIAKHGRRADDIVRGMMAHARTGDSERLSVAVNDFMTEYLNLAWHGYRARYPGLKASLDRDLAPDVGNAKLASQDLGRVIINLVVNALDEVRDQDDGRIRVSSHRLKDRIEIRVADNGRGVPEELRVKIFEPFYTTKPTGEGTGLGLSMAHDIVTQGHGGTMRVETNADGGATFVICLPLIELS